jgi:CBS domain-containing protein
MPERDKQGLAADQSRLQAEARGGSDIAASGAGQAVFDYMTSSPVTIGATQNLYQASSLMREEDIGSVIVMDSDRVHGILTDRDIVIRALADGRDPEDTEVGSICSTELQTIAPDASVQEAVELMRSKAVRRVIVLEGQTPVGILSLGDISELNAAGEALEEISEARANV